jgi:hypothetical protein
MHQNFLCEVVFKVKEEEDEGEVQSSLCGYIASISTNSNLTMDKASYFIFTWSILSNFIDHLKRVDI